MTASIITGEIGYVAILVRLYDDSYATNWSSKEVLCLLYTFPGRRIFCPDGIIFFTTTTLFLRTAVQRRIERNRQRNGEK